MIEERTIQRKRDRERERETVPKFSMRMTVFIFRKIFHILGWGSLWYLKAFQSRLLLLWKNLSLI